MSDILVAEGLPRGGKQLVVQFPDMGNGTHARAVFLADGAFDANTDLAITEGFPFTSHVVRYQPMESGGGFARGIVLSDGGEGAPARADVVVPVGPGLAVMYRSMSDGTQAEVMFESDDVGLQSGDKVLMEGLIPVRYKALGNGLFARTIIMSEGDEAPPSTNDRIVPIGYPTIAGQATKFFRALGDGSFAELLFVNGGLPNPEINPVEDGLLLNSRYILFGDDNMVLA